jgi:hypothetical protein
MRRYFFGDIHGNRDALEACLKHLDDRQADEAYCLGDLVGWLPFGDRTLNRMRSLDLPTVAGNHDLLVSGIFTDHPDQLDRMQASAYNAGLLSTIPGAIDYLCGLPLLLAKTDFVVVHHSPFHLPKPGAPPTIDSFNYLDEAALTQCMEAWHAAPWRLIFSGHDHVPGIYELRETEGPEGSKAVSMENVKVHRPSPNEDLTLRLNPRSRYWIKAASVGGPYRDGIAMANSVLYDSDSETVTLFRIPYPTDSLYRQLSSHRFCRNLATLQRYMELLRQGNRSEGSTA